MIANIIWDSRKRHRAGGGWVLVVKEGHNAYHIPLIGERCQRDAAEVDAARIIEERFTCVG